MALAACSSSNDTAASSGSGNAAPVANAGVAQDVYTGHVVTLDGTASHDPDGAVTLGYAWRFTARPAGSTATLSAAATAHATFTPDLAGTYTARLVVSDGELLSSPSDVSVTATVENLAPVANAGAIQYVPVNNLVTLDGSASSDPNGDSITYQWTLTAQPGTSSVSLSGATTAHPTFTPDTVGTYAASLVVSDGTLASAPATVEIGVLTGNAAPVANAGADQHVNQGTLVTLDGSGSRDADGDPLTYTWSFTTVPTGSTAALSDPSAVGPTFTPDLAGTYVVKLVVYDGHFTTPATVNVIANGIPTANAGAHQLVRPGTLVTLDGSASSDFEGSALTHLWAPVLVPTGSTATLSSTTAVNPTFTADLVGSYQFSLVVNDGTVSSPASTVTVDAVEATTTTFLPSYETFSAYLGPYTATTTSQSINFTTTGTIDAPGSPATLRNPSSGRLRLYDSANVDPNTSTTIYAINYNGASLSGALAEGTTVDLATSQRDVAMLYPATPFPVTVTVKYTNASTCSLGVIAIADASGKVLKSQSGCDAAQSPATVTFTDPANTGVYVVYSRNGETTGGIRVFRIDVFK
jgi:hypothetical protein